MGAGVLNVDVTFEEVGVSFLEKKQTNFVQVWDHFSTGARLLGLREAN
jgi:hypothetical protein